MQLLIVIAKNFHDKRQHVCPLSLFNPTHMEKVGIVSETLESKATQILNATLKKFDAPTKWCMITANWLPLYTTETQRKEFDQIEKHDMKIAGEHWKNTQFWQGGCNVGSKIVSKLLEKYIE
jgi:hypothetical protein